jgi:phage tail-like protein
VIAVNEREFSVQVLETKAQWESGLRRRLALNDDGLTLFVNPDFDSWLVTEDWQSGAGDIVVDECGQVCWTALEVDAAGKRVWRLLRRNPLTLEIERVLTFKGCGSIEPRKLWLTKEYLWVFDQHSDDQDAGTSTGRMVALSRQTFQIIHEVIVENLIDLDFDRRGFFYTLAKDNDGCTQLCRHSFAPRTTDCFPNRREWNGSTKLAVGPKGMVYLLNTVIGRILRFDPKTQQLTLLAAPQQKLLKGFKASVMEIDDRGVIFLASNKSGSEPAALHMFDEDGSCLDQAELPSSINTIDGIGFDPKGGIYLATDQGLARFSLASNPIGLEGLFYSPSLDNGKTESAWHRLALKGSFPTKSRVDVFYFSSDDETLKNEYDRAIGSSGSVEERAQAIEDLLRPRWIGPEIFSGSDFEEPRIPDEEQSIPVSPDLVLDPNKGRFLWFKLRLVTFDRQTRPSVSSARVYYPRLSYLRYLPPVYGEDSVSAAFLERFLSLFETIFEGLDQQIDELHRHFDSRLTPPGFLSWLASWVGLTLDDDVPEDRVRRFIQRSSSLYNRKGTAEALIEFLEIYTGRPVFLIEHLRGLKPLVLGDRESGFILGNRTMLLSGGPKGMRVGDTSVVGYAAVRDRIADPEEPFLSVARRFTVVFDMDPGEFQKREGTLQRIVAEQKPAHTSCSLRALRTQGEVGNAVLGVGGSVGGPQPYRVGMTSLGSGSAVTRDPTLRLERGAWIGSLKRLQ